MRIIDLKDILYVELQNAYSHFLCLSACIYIANSRYVVQHCSLTKPQPGNDLITAVWLVNGGLLNWASIAFFTRHVFSMLPLRHTLYNLSNGSQRMVSILCWCQLCTFLFQPFGDVIATCRKDSLFRPFECKYVIQNQHNSNVNDSSKAQTSYTVALHSYLQNSFFSRI